MEPLPAAGKTPLSRPPKNRGRYVVMEDPERVAFIRTLASVSAFIGDLETAFRTNEPDHLAQVDRVAESFRNMLDSAGHAGDVGLMISHGTRGLRECLSELGAAVREKAGKHLTFSKGATREFESLCRDSRVFLRTALDFLRTDNPVLLEWLDNKQKACQKTCAEYAASHAQRLIDGICDNSASIVYLDMLHSFKDIHSQTLHIVRLLAGLCGIGRLNHHLL